MMGLIMGFVEPGTSVEELGEKVKDISPYVLADMLGVLTIHLETTMESEVLTGVLSTVVRGILSTQLEGKQS